MGLAAERKSSTLRTVPRKLQDFIRRIRWFNFTFLVLIPFAGLIQAFWVPLRLRTLIWSAVYYVLTAGSITTGEQETRGAEMIAKSDQGITDYGLTGPTQALQS